MKKYYAAKYLRLSDADRDKEKRNKNLSDSIENQSIIIENYLKYHNEIEVYDTYIDDGKTGMNYEREAYQRMMKDIEKGVINCVIVKDLSRIGREHCETIYLLKKIFPLSGIRFIAVVDNIDINDTVNQGIDVPFKVVVNDYYSQNISFQVRNAYRAKERQGKFIGSFTSYGYIKDPKDKNKLIIDEEAAQVVRRIFHEYLYGKSIRSIARGLNEEGIYSPTEYKRRIQGVNYKNDRAEIGLHWTYTTIKSMLKKRVYVGDMVQHTVEKVAYNIEKRRNIPPEEYNIVKNTHEAIIEEETFEKVQRLLQESKYRQTDFQNQKGKGIENIYRGLLFCGDCGYAMSKIKYSTTEKSKNMGFRCGQYARIGKGYCSSHFINKATLDSIVLTEIRKNVKKALEMIDSDELMNTAIGKQRNNAEEQIKRLEEQKNKLLQEKKRMLSNLSKKVIAEEDFLLYNESYEEEMNLINKNVLSLTEKNAEANRNQNECEIWINNFMKYKAVSELNRGIMVNLVEKIKIFEDKTVEIKFYFKNPFEI